MKIVKELGLAGIADFKKSVLPIMPGVTYLYGYNALDNGNPNAAGKSVLASAAADIFYDTPMVGEKQDRPKIGMRAIKWMERKSVHSVRSTFEGKSEKIRYRVDGEVREGRTAKATREMVRRAWAVTEDDYRTYGYLDAANPHPLVRGSSSARKAFFTSFFQLDKLDAERKILAKHALELKRVRAQHTELDKTFQEIKQDMLTREVRAELETKVAKWESQLKRLRSQAEEAQRAKALKDFEAYAKPHLKEFRALVADIKEFDDVLKSLKKALRRAVANKEQAEEYEVYQKEFAVYRRRTEGLDMSKDLSELEALARKVQKAKLELEAGSTSEPGERPEEVQKPKIEKAKLQARSYQLEHELEHAAQFKKGECPTCGQSVKMRKPAEIQEELDTVTARLKAWRRYEKYVAEVTEWKSVRAEHEKHTARKKELKAVIKAHAADVDVYNKRREISKPAKVEKPDAYRDPAKIEAQLKVLEFFEPHLDRLAALATFDGRVEPFDLAVIETLQNKISAAQAKLEVHNTVKTRAAKIRKRLHELEAELKDEPALTLVLQAYSDKNVKKMAVNEISRQLMATVNRYAPIAFPGYTFEFVWGSKVQLLVHRPKGTTDVRKLSGAESKLFTLILVMSQLMFVPKAKRLSLLVLDEPSASFSAATLDKFHKLLPHLQQLIPSILVVTPKSEERFPGASEYTVYRDSSGAEIRKGHPSDF